MKLLPLVTAVGLFWGPPQSQELQPTEPAETPPGYEQILDQVLPVELGVLQYQLMDRYDWVFLARVTPAFAESESLYIVKKPSNGGPIEAVLLQAKRRIFTQWLDEWSLEPGITAQGAAKRVGTIRREYRGDECAPLGGLAERLEKVRIRLIPNLGLRLDATTYEILAARWTSAVRASYSGPGSGAESQPNEVLEVVEALRRDLKACSQH